MKPELREYVVDIVRATLRNHPLEMIELTVQHMEKFVPNKLKTIQGTPRMNGKYVLHTIRQEAQHFAAQKENIIELLLRKMT